jgi:hypothetical protein
MSYWYIAVAGVAEQQNSVVDIVAIVTVAEIHQLAENTS